MKGRHADLLVIGGGIAGMYAALTARSYGATVVLASKTPLTGGSTYWAQGGVAAPLSWPDEAAHERDTLAAGRGLCEPEAVQVFVHEARQHVEALKALGVPFEHGMTLEGGHDRARVRHAYGDATGRAISETLATLTGHGLADGSCVLEGAFARSLLQDDAGRVQGAVFLTNEGPLEVRAGGVLLATGGYGRVYPVTTAPPEVTGDGVALAYRAGASVRDLEFVQFHPTVVVADGEALLVTEAARGEGARLLNAHGERFMPRYDAALELAPRDVVARAIASERRTTGAVFLDLRQLGAAFVHGRFPGITERLARVGLDLGRDLIPVEPAVHYSVGGVRTDLHGRTDLDGLYAAGEVASSGLHGANRLASNSLSEGLVFGVRAVRAALADGQTTAGSLRERAVPGLRPDLLPQLKATLADAAGLLRSGPGLQAALAGWPVETVPGQTRAELEAANIALVGELLLRGALARRETRGCHARTDHPEEGVPMHTVQRQGELSLEPIHPLLGVGS